jgi:hypothetical protein
MDLHLPNFVRRKPAHEGAQGSVSQDVLIPDGRFRVVIRVVIRRKNGSDLDEVAWPIRNLEPKTCESHTPGWVPF